MEEDHCGQFSYPTIQFIPQNGMISVAYTVLFLPASMPNDCRVCKLTPNWGWVSAFCTSMLLAPSPLQLAFLSAMDICLWLSRDEEWYVSICTHPTRNLAAVLLPSPTAGRARVDVVVGSIGSNMPSTLMLGIPPQHPASCSKDSAKLESDCPPQDVYGKTATNTTDGLPPSGMRVYVTTEAVLRQQFEAILGAAGK